MAVSIFLGIGRSPTAREERKHLTSCRQIGSEEKLAYEREVRKHLTSCRQIESEEKLAYESVRGDFLKVLLDKPLFL